MQVKKYKKRPVTIEAVKFNLTQFPVIQREFCPVLRWTLNPDWDLNPNDVQPTWEFNCWIETLQGNMGVKPGDYIVKGTRGEFYPHKGDIFEQNYYEVQE